MWVKVAKIRLGADFKWGPLLVAAGVLMVPVAAAVHVFDFDFKIDVAVAL